MNTREIQDRINMLEDWIHQCEFMYSWKNSVFHRSDEIMVFREKAIHQLEELKVKMEESCE